MSEKPTWARGPNEYVDRLALPGPSVGNGLSEVERHRFEDTGLTWGAFDVEAILPSPVQRSRARFRAQLPDLVWNAAALEGNTFTLPEVRTLLDGVTVGGRKLEDEQQILALSEGYTRLDTLIGEGRFALSKTVSDELHAIVARHEAIEAGNFRGEGSVHGGGRVNLASGGSVPGTAHGEGGRLLRQHFEDLTRYLDGEPDPRRGALIYFASATRRQFYFDGNKRTARLMMTGALISGGYDSVSIPFARRLEFNTALDRLFAEDDATTMLRFLTTCTVLDA